VPLAPVRPGPRERLGRSAAGLGVSRLVACEVVQVQQGARVALLERRDELF